MVVQGRKCKTPDRKLPTSRISNIASLKKFPDKQQANDILHQVAKAVAPIMHENDFKVGLLCEMYPKSGNLLGLNINKGAKIMLRLRYHSNSRLFLPIGDIIGTMLHELTHNLYGLHNQQFYRFLDQLKDRFEQIQYSPNAVKGYVCEENQLGKGNTLASGYSSIRDKRLKVLETGKFKAERRRLGGSNSNTNSKGVSKAKARNDPSILRMFALEAAERRLKDAKWCNSNEREHAEPGNDELEIVNVESDKEKRVPFIVDLTKDNEHKADEPEVVIID